MSQSNKNDVSDSVCVVCFKPIEIYSIGDCDHPVCFECSTRMRVLCQQTECPICRHDITKVIFTYKVEPYKVFFERFTSKKMLHDEKYKIVFTELSIKEAYLKLLEHHCTKCGAIFRMFNNLREHMSKKHEFYYCDLCVDNLKIFTSERKFYTRSQLALHRRKGDPDDTSHKGHPLCEFCDTRYMDTDELFRHLRKDHLYCHICDADGFHQYYVSFHTLRDHFRKDHYLCEEGDCCSEGNMTVFRSDIDFKAHKASEHGRGLSKQAARQARTLEVQFTLTPRPIPARVHHRMDRNEGDTSNRGECSRDMMSEISQLGVTDNIPVVDMDSIKQFPTLGDSGTSSTSTVPLSRQEKPFNRQTSGALARTDENFPALSSDTTSVPSASFRLNISHPVPSNTVIRTNVKPNVCIQVHNQPSTSNNNRANSSEVRNKNCATLFDENRNKKFLEEFPSLNKKDKNLLLNNYSSYATVNTASVKKVAANQLDTNTVKEPTVLQPTYNKVPPPQSLDAFPALQSSSPLSVASTSCAPTQPQWIAKVKTKETAPKQSKVNVEPQLSKPLLNDISEFPTPPPTSGISSWSNKRNEPNKVKLGKPQWVVPKKDQAPKLSKVAPAPEIPTQSLNISDFPSLKCKQKKKKLREMETDVNDNSLNLQSREKDVTTNKENEKTTRNNKKKFNNGNTASQTSTQSNTSVNQTVQANSESKILKTKPLPNLSPRSSSINSKSTFVSPQCNGFTFTNSSGENYNIPAHNYVQPINFNERNKALVSKFMEILGKTEAIHEFKSYSQLFRQGSYSASYYYKYCMESMKEGFKYMFPELLVLLPDIHKQQQLYNIHFASTGSSLHVCDICGQILITSDVQFHKDFHTMQSAFPALGPPSQAGGSKQK